MESESTPIVSKSKTCRTRFCSWLKDRCDPVSPEYKLEGMMIVTNTLQLVIFGSGTLYLAIYYYSIQCASSSTHALTYNQWLVSSATITTMMGVITLINSLLGFLRTDTFLNHPCIPLTRKHYALLLGLIIHTGWWLTGFILFLDRPYSGCHPDWVNGNLFYLIYGEILHLCFFIMLWETLYLLSPSLN